MMVPSGEPILITDPKKRKLHQKRNLKKMAKDKRSHVYSNRENRIHLSAIKKF